MKTIGLIGGLSWESTAAYYRIINETVNARLGGLHSAKCLIDSVDFSEIEAYQRRGQWDRCAEAMADAARRLEAAGADFIVVCANTMHKVAPQIEAAVCIPLLHVAHATADALQSGGIARAALLGTKYTMTQDFYKDVLRGRGIDVVTPNEADMETIDRVIYDELCRGIVSDTSRAAYARIAESLARQGAQAVILGCTEIGMLLRPSDVSVPLFDTTVIHATRAALLAIGE